ncbi:hypothetical protein [Pseudorhodoferax sp.]|uniref:hypothetical protein n=1 Tax=Pseudorhodoferax sp. TaxID=1993553 RepID=UPI002DD6A8E4|nr:hypothetical protein [Pseudorhodoferax sp.]
MHARFLALSCPPCVAVAGSALLTLGAAMLGLGLRLNWLQARLDRAAQRTGVDLPDAIDAWPWWLQLIAPESWVGFAVAVLIAAAGAHLSSLARWARKFHG